MSNLYRYDFETASKTLKIDPGFSHDNYLEVEHDLDLYRGLSIVKYGLKPNLTGNVLTIKSKLVKGVVAIGGDNCSLYVDEDVSGNVTIVLWRNSSVHIGKSTTINEAKIIADNSDVFIGEDCLLSDGILIQSNDQHGLFDLAAGLMLNSARRKLLVEDHVWIGRRVVLMPDIVVGKGSVLSTCGVVTKDVPAFSYAAGVPAKVVRETASWFRSPGGPNMRENIFFSAYGFDVN